MNACTKGWNDTKVLFLLIERYKVMKWIKDLHVSLCKINYSYFTARNEALHALNIDQVTSLADSCDSPIICADLEVYLQQVTIHFNPDLRAARA